MSLQIRTTSFLWWSESISVSSGFRRGAVALRTMAVVREIGRVAALGDGRGGVLGGLHDEGNSADGVVVLHVHHADALRGAAVAVDALDRRSLDHAVGRDEDQILVLPNDEGRG